MATGDSTPKLDPREEHHWTAGPRAGMRLFLRRYLDTDTQSRTRDPASVQVPADPVAEIARALRGELAYDPSLVRAPTAILRGEWDSLATDADAHWLWNALTQGAAKRDVKIGGGTHLMHLEAMQLALWHESATFLSDDDVADLPA